MSQDKDQRIESLKLPTNGLRKLKRRRSNELLTKTSSFTICNKS